MSEDFLDKVARSIFRKLLHKQDRSIIKTMEESKPRVTEWPYFTSDIRTVACPSFMFSCGTFNAWPSPEPDIVMAHKEEPKLLEYKPVEED